MSTVAESVRRSSPNSLRIVATEPPESHFVGSVRGAENEDLGKLQIECLDQSSMLLEAVRTFRKRR